MTIPKELRPLLERVARPVLFRRQEDAHADACAELRAILAHPNQQGEAVEVVGYMGTSDRLWADTTRPELIFPLMTVAQHNRILAATVPAGCKVVPVELLEQIAVELEHDNDRYFLGRELRALLASAEGVKDE